jgi:hypothetical protein
MNRITVIESIIAEQQRILQEVIHSSLEASDYAIHEESRAESKWDTQALEASYLAAGHAAKAKEMRETIQSLQGFLANFTEVSQAAINGSLVKCEFPSGVEYFFISKFGGGVEVTVDGSLVTVLNPGTPMGRSIIGKEAGESFNLPNGVSVKLIEVL